MRQERLADLNRLVLGDRDLIPILTGIAQTRDAAFNAVDIDHGGFHELQIARGRAEFTDNIFRCRALHGHQRPVEDLGHFDAVQIGLHMRNVLMPQRRVHHHKVMIARIRHDQVIHDPAICIGKEPVPRLAFLQRRKSLRTQSFQLLTHIFTAQNHLTHVRHIKQRRLLATLLMLPHDPQRILDRHLPTRKINHLTTQLNMQIVQGRASNIGHGGYFPYLAFRVPPRQSAPS